MAIITLNPMLDEPTSTPIRRPWPLSESRQHARTHVRQPLRRRRWGLRFDAGPPKRRPEGKLVSAARPLGASVGVLRPVRAHNGPLTTSFAVPHAARPGRLLLGAPRAWLRRLCGLGVAGRGAAGALWGALRAPLILRPRASL